MDRTTKTFMWMCALWMLSFAFTLIAYAHERINVERLSDAIRNARDNGDTMICPMVQHCCFDTARLSKYAYCY